MNELPPPSLGRLLQAKRFALMRFDEWNDVTGFATPHTGYYYEITSIIEDAVEYGFGVAHGASWKEINERIEASAEVDRQAAFSALKSNEPNETN